MTGKKYTIALFVGDMENEYSEEVFLGAAHQAELMDINLIVFPVKYIEFAKQDSKYQYQYNCLFSYAEHGNFDAAIFETAVMGKYASNSTLAAIIQKFENDHIQIITISEKVKNYPCISFDSNGIELEIEHLIKHHNARRIGFVSGPTTNLEAIDRFKEYKHVLEKCNIPFDPNLISEGDFTENCEEATEILLKKNKNNIDAVCYASDKMAIAGYRVMSRHGIVIGKDIMVTGFDDIPGSDVMKPPLTTIRASYRELGVTAVEAAFKASEEKINDIKVSTTLITRDSCGCKSTVTENRESLEYLIYTNSSVEVFVEKINEIIFSYCNNTNYQLNRRIINLFLQFSTLFLKHIEENKNINKELLLFKFNVLLNYNILDSISIQNFNFLMTSLCNKAVSIAKNQEHKELVYMIFMEMFKLIIIYTNDRSDTIRNEIRDNINSINTIISKAVDGYSISRPSPLSIISKFPYIDIRSCYLYLHEAPVISHSRNDWIQPEYEILHSYHNGNEVKTLSTTKFFTPDLLFRNKYLPDRRFTFIVSPLFCSEENYGIILNDIDLNDHLFYGPILTSQISYAIKLKNMLDEQNIIQSHLLASLEEAKDSNKILSQISQSDELTGIFNRRGFMENVLDLINKNYGKKAIIIYADMDNLKQINDIFGHDEGDFAICSAAKILMNSIRKNDIAARFGGDEFAAFAIIEEEIFSETFMKRLENLCRRFNRICDKPYNIHLSAGTHTFICSKDTSLTKMMNEADKHLYENKKFKNPSVLKNPDNFQNDL